MNIGWNIMMCGCKHTFRNNCQVAVETFLWQQSGTFTARYNRHRLEPSQATPIQTATSDRLAHPETVGFPENESKKNTPDTGCYLWKNPYNMFAVPFIQLLYLEMIRSQSTPKPPPSLPSLSPGIPVKNTQVSGIPARQPVACLSFLSKIDPRAPWPIFSQRETANPWLIFHCISCLTRDSYNGLSNNPHIVG